MQGGVKITMASRWDEATEVAGKLADELDADIILFNQGISDESADKLHDRLYNSNIRKNVFFILSSFGGDAHAAYLIARELQICYSKVILCIAGDCFSAGTLIALCAHEIVLTNRSRLGPLDVQILKKDELSERLSGLTVGIALDELQDRLSQSLAKTAYDLKQAFGRQLSFRTALDIASNVTSEVYGEIFRQIDPVRLGEDARSLQIAQHYGDILGKYSENLKPNAVHRLLTRYPSHDCIIDKGEAEELFKNLREPTDSMAVLLEKLGTLATDASNEALNILVVLNKNTSTDRTQSEIPKEGESFSEDTRNKNEGAESESRSKSRTRTKGTNSGADDQPGKAERSESEGGS